MKGYLGGLIRMTGLNAVRAAGNVRTNIQTNVQTNVQDARHTAPRPIHREDTVMVQTPPSHTNYNSPLQEILPGRTPEMNPSQSSHEPGHRDISTAVPPNSTESPTPQLFQNTITINPSKTKTKPPRNPQDSPDAHVPDNPQKTSPPPGPIETSQIRQIRGQANNTAIETSQIRQIRGQANNTANNPNNPKNPVPETSHTTFNPMETTETLQIRGQIRGQANKTPPITSPGKRTEIAEIKEIREIRGQANKAGNPGNPTSHSSHPAAIPTEQSSFTHQSAAEPVPGKVESPMPQEIPVITLEDIRQYVAESESPPAQTIEEPQSPPPIGHDSMDHIISVPAAQPQKPAQVMQPEPIETQQFNLSIGSINLTVEAPEPQMQTVSPPRPEPKRQASYSGEATNTRWGRNYIRVK